MKGSNNGPKCKKKQSIAEGAQKERQFREAMSSVEPAETYSVGLPNGQQIHFFVKFQGQAKKAKDTFAKFKCKECTDRIGKWAYACGPNGPILHSGLSNEKKFQEMIDLDHVMNTQSKGATPELIVIEDAIVPPLEDPKADTPENGVPFLHETFVPKHVTSPENAQKLGPLSKKYHTSMDGYLSKCTKYHMDRFKMVSAAAERSEHPAHFKHALKWLQDILIFCDGKSFISMTPIEKIRVRIFALMTGTVDQTTGNHLTFHSALMLVDFMEMFDVDKVISAINHRLDESNYMVRDAQKILSEKGIIQDRTISLFWKSRHDLDLYVRNKHSGELYYHNHRKGPDGHLNHDANYNEVQKSPVENFIVTKPGEFEISVAQFGLNGGNAVDVQFMIVARRLGQPDEIFENVWLATRGSYTGEDTSKMLCVATVSFSENPEIEVVLSDKASSAMLTKHSEYRRLIGDPISIVATSEDLHGSGQFIPFGGDVVKQTQTQTQKPRQYGARYMDFAAPPPPPSSSEFALSLVTKPASNKYAGLYVPTFSNVSEFMQFCCENGARLNMKVLVSSICPGFIVKVTCNTDIMKHNGISPVAYRDTGCPPNRPSCSGNCRDFHHFLHETDPTEYVNVIGIVRLGGDVPPFLVIEGARLPNHSAFQLKGAAGMYPTSLTSTGHPHRATFGIAASQTKPQMPTAVSGAGVLLLGGFVYENFPCRINGKNVEFE